MDAWARIVPGPNPPMNSFFSDFDIEWLQDGPCVFVRLSGDLDLSSAPWFAQQLRRADLRGFEIVVDLERVTFMDGAGLHALLDASADMGPARFSVTPGPPQVQRLFELTGINRELRVGPRPLTIARRAA